MNQKFPKELLSLIAQLKKLPGVGSKTAERFAFELLSWKEEDLKALGETLRSLKEKVLTCTTCGCIASERNCRFCEHRDPKKLCIIASAKDAFFIDESTHYSGLYHVIEHLLSPIDGKHLDELRIDLIEKRIEENKIDEIIIALDSTLEADTTALFLKNHLSKPGISVSRLAFGLPVGSSLDYIDASTLNRAFAGRHSI